MFSTLLSFVKVTNSGRFSFSVVVGRALRISSLQACDPHGGGELFIVTSLIIFYNLWIGNIWLLQFYLYVYRSMSIFVVYFRVVLQCVPKYVARAIL